MVVEGPCFAEWPFDIPCDSVHESMCQPGAMVYGSVVLNLPRFEAHALNAG